MAMTNGSWTLSYLVFIWRLSPILSLQIDRHTRIPHEAHLISNLKALVDIAYLKFFSDRYVLDILILTMRDLIINN